ncbi:pogo transposable element with KRAB domain [Rhizophagus clarus]|uniref:Pogo transposable element with KRAB domain n=2 Tax=Rhizophagus clarus TaxID=94130 RepID=A0A8H3QT39_9GLOM|nr:pogo transposable element with KRAB domain [Rhizophagus clarus]
MARGNFGICRARPKQLREWINNKEKLLNAAPYTQRLNTGARPKYPYLEAELIEWVKEARSQLKTVTRYMWVDGFMSHHKLVNRRKTTVAQRLPEDYVEQQGNFLSYILYRRNEHNYPLSLIGNMDETPMAFNLPSNNTIEQSGTKTVSILSTGHERSNFTVVLACMADGTKLPPVIIFKLKNIPREVFPDGVIIRTNPEGWMNENEMTWWIENVWTRRASRNNNPRSLLVLDSFSAHKTDVVKQRFREKKTDLAVIPGGLTSRLQPLDVSLNRSFKAKVRNLYNNWMSEAIKDYTPSGKIKRPSYSLVASWVKEGWDAIDTSMIRRSFKCCGISNATDGTEDTLIFDFNQLESKINRENLGREVEKDGENNDKENESESEGNDRNELEDDESELKDNYYEENEEQTVIQDWS